MTGSFSKRQSHVSLLGKYIHPVACLTYIIHQPSFIIISVTSMSSPHRVLGQVSDISFAVLNQDASLSRSWYCNSRNLLNLMSEPKGGLKQDPLTDCAGASEWSLSLQREYTATPAEHAQPNKTTNKNRRPKPRKTHLLSHVRPEILIRRDVHAHAPVLQPGGLDLVRRARHGRHDDVRESEATREVELGRRVAHDMVRVEGTARTFPCARGRRGPFGVFLDRVDVDGEDARAVVRKERRERAPDDLRSRCACVCAGVYKVVGAGMRDVPVDDGDGASVGAVAVWQ